MQPVNPFFSESFKKFVSEFPKTLSMELSCKNFNNLSNRKGSIHLQDVIMDVNKVLEQRKYHPEFKDHPFKYLMYVSSVSVKLEEFLSSNPVKKICAFENIMKWIMTNLNWRFDPESEKSFYYAFIEWFGYEAKEKRTEFSMLLDVYNNIEI